MGSMPINCKYKFIFLLLPTSKLKHYEELMPNICQKTMFSLLVVADYIQFSFTSINGESICMGHFHLHVYQIRGLFLK